MAYFLPRVWSSPAASHNAHFDSAAVSTGGGKKNAFKAVRGSVREDV